VPPALEGAGSSTRGRCPLCSRADQHLQGISNFAMTHLCVVLPGRNHSVEQRLEHQHVLTDGHQGLYICSASIGLCI
jgi:hypothetical protein